LLIQNINFLIEFFNFNKNSATNVMEILKLADYFQIEQLRKLCGQHLCTCVEHPMLELLYWSDIYGLDNVVVGGIEHLFWYS